jgi:hypothetical protein
MSMGKYATRLQFTLYYKLQAEVIVEDYAAAKQVEWKYFDARYRKGLSIGGCIMQLASLPRYFDVNVGDAIQVSEGIGKEISDAADMLLNKINGF